MKSLKEIESLAHELFPMFQLKPNESIEDVIERVIPFLNKSINNSDWNFDKERDRWNNFETGDSIDLNHKSGDWTYWRGGEEEVETNSLEALCVKYKIKLPVKHKVLGIVKVSEKF